MCLVFKLRSRSNLRKIWLVVEMIIVIYDAVCGCAPAGSSLVGQSLRVLVMRRDREVDCR